MVEHALVVGAAGAIGSALARELRRRAPAARLSLADRDERGIEALAAELGGAAPVPVDLTAPDAAPALVARAVAAHGPVEGLVNAAGIMEVVSLHHMSWDDALRVLQIDLLAPMQLMHAVLRPMVDGGRGGFVINVTSMAGRVALRGCAAYGAAKAGLSMASEIAHAEASAHGIRVLTVYPGPVASPLEQRARAQYERTAIAARAPTGDPAVLAVRTFDALERGAARLVYPRLYRAGLWSPALADRIALALGPSPTLPGPSAAPYGALP